MRRLCLAAGPWLMPRPAHAHVLDVGPDALGQFVQGAATMLIHPGLLLPLLAVGVFLSLWSEDGLLRVWPVFLAAQIAGVFLAALAAPWIGMALMGAGIVTAGIAALLPPRPATPAFGMAGATGLLTMMTALEAHGPYELPVFTYLGLLFGANLVPASAASATRLAISRVTAGWMRIGWRVAASWIGAILLLTLAFEMSGGLS